MDGKVRSLLEKATVEGSSSFMRSQGDQSSVPKFGSFRPKASQAVPQEPPRERRRDNTKDDLAGFYKSKKKTATEEKRREDGREHKAHRRRDGRGDTALQTATTPEPTPVAKTWDEEALLYTIDRKGDPQNAIYGKPNQYQVPAYRLKGAIDELGNRRNRKIDHRGNEGPELVARTSSQKKQTNLLSSNFPVEESGRERFVSATQQNEDLDYAADFISFRSSKKRKHGSLSAGSEVGSESRLDWKTTDDMSDLPHVSTWSDVKSLSSDSDQESPREFDAQESSVQVENSRLARLVKTEPNNVSAWIQLINHQDQINGHAYDYHSSKSSAKRALADIKLSIYKDALKSIGKHTSGREDLLIKFIEEGTQIWDSKTTASKWQNILRENPNSLSLRLRYLSFCQSEMSKFRYDDCRNAMLDVLTTFKSMENPNLDLPDANLTETQIYLFLRLTRLMHECGYQEQALALWQGTMEYYLFRPDLSKTTKQSKISQPDLLKYFEEFWDEEVPRFGEANANGWRNFYECGGAPPSPKVNHVDYSINRRSWFEDFVEAEKLLTKSNQEPGRTTDETRSNDTYHMVLSSDLIPILSVLPYSVAPQLLIDALTCFCRMAPVPDLDRPVSQQKWWSDPFLYDGTFQSTAKSPFGTASTEPLSSKPSPFFGQTTPIILFSSLGTPKSSAVSNDWMRHCLKSFTDALPQSDGLEEYRLAFEYHHDATIAKRTAKALLKKRSNSLRLWNAYALGEYRAGHAEAADNAFSAALQMSQTLSKETQADEVFLRLTGIWDALHRSRFDLALSRAIITNQNSSQNAASTVQAMEEDTSLEDLINTQRSLQSEQLKSLSARQYQRFAAVTECLAFVSYLPKVCLEDALLIYQSTLDLVAFWKLGLTPVAECIHLARASLIIFHISSGRKSIHSSIYGLPIASAHPRAWAYKTDVIRKTLRESLSQFPNNTFVLDAHALNELRFPVIERETSLSDFHNHSESSLLLKQEEVPRFSNVLHGKHDILDLKEPSVIRFCHAVATFMERLHSDSDQRPAMIYKLRSIFQRAVASPRARHNARLWKSYLGFEIDIAGINGDLGKAREVFFQGLRLIPWYKAFAMMGFAPRGMLSNEELKGLWETMVEREFRIYVDVEPPTENAH